MLRKVYVIITLLNIVYFHGKLCIDCPNNTAAILAVCAVSNLKNNVVNYFIKKAKIVEKTRLRAKHGLLKFFNDMRNGTDPYDSHESRKARINISRRRNSTTNKPAVVPASMRKNYMKKFIAKNAEDLIKAHGYKPESHYIFTTDGYMLTIHRMMSIGDIYFSQNFEKGAVLLHHGLLGSSDDWLLLETPLTLPYLLLNYGYDVWLLNARGNKYTTISSAKTRNTYTNRDFSWHEMGIYDLPATITYISNYTGSTNLYYIGHSTGATAMLVLLSSMPEYNSKLKSAIFLAPLAFMHHTRGPLKLFSEFPNASKEYIAKGVFPEEIMDIFCQGTQRSCSNTLLFLTNGGKVMWDEDNIIHDVLMHVPAGGSTKTLAHYIQLIQSTRFRMFDYGPIENVKIYNSTFPPDYKLNAITLHISIFVSSGDWISTVSDAITLTSKLKNVRSLHILRKDSFSHVDFMWSTDASNMVYKVILNILDTALNITQVNNSIERTTADDLETEDD